VLRAQGERRIAADRGHRSPVVAGRRWPRARLRADAPLTPLLPRILLAEDRNCSTGLARAACGACSCAFLTLGARQGTRRAAGRAARRVTGPGLGAANSLAFEPDGDGRSVAAGARAGARTRGLRRARRRIRAQADTGARRSSAVARAARSAARESRCQLEHAVGSVDLLEALEERLWRERLGTEHAGAAPRAL